MLYRFVSGDLPITLLLYGVLYLWAASHRSLLSAIAFRDTAIWNRIGQATLIVVGIFPLWVALADNWRHLLAYGLPVGQRWKSDPFEAAATAEPLRLVTLALLGLGLLGTALLFARHRGSLPTALLTAWTGVCAAASALGCVLVLTGVGGFGLWERLAVDAVIVWQVVAGAGLLLAPAPQGSQELASA